VTAEAEGGECAGVQLEIGTYYETAIRGHPVPPSQRQNGDAAVGWLRQLGHRDNRRPPWHQDPRAPPFNAGPGRTTRPRSSSRLCKRRCSDQRHAESSPPAAATRASSR
jgi:hypothetical protein